MTKLHRWNENGRWSHSATIACPSLNLAFVLVPKTGSTSVAKVLLEANGERAGTDPGSIHRLRKRYAFEFGQLPDHVHTYAVVRHPVERLFCVWHGKINEGKPSQLRSALGFVTFRDFVGIVENEGPAMDGHTARQTDFVCNPDGSIRVGRVLRYERLQEEWDDLRRIHKGLSALPHLNAKRWSGHLHQERIDYDLRKRIIDLYASDMRAFGYAN